MRFNSEKFIKMKKIHIKWIYASVALLFAAFAVSSCSDDHFDVNKDGTNASGDLWENLEATGKVDSFMMILEGALVDAKSYGTLSTYTYKELLQSTRTMTLWAPEDGTYDEGTSAKYWLDLLDDGEYETVETKFVQNHLANYNYTGAYPDEYRLRLPNEKYVTYDVANSTFNDIAIDSLYENVPATNGTIHLLQGMSPFLCNLREILEEEESLSDLYEYVLSKDTLIFDDENSTVGATVDGQIQYVDSVFIERNELLPDIANDEDSLVVAIYPSNEAWAEALEMVAPYYVYHESNQYAYWDDDLEEYLVDSLDCDSLAELFSAQAIINNMFYSLNEQPGFDADNASVETVAAFFSSGADSLVSTEYYNSKSAYHQFAPDCWELTEGKTPEECSNGYMFITDHFNFSPTKLCQYPIQVEAEETNNLNSTQRLTANLSTASPTGDRQTVTESNANPYITGEVSEDAYQIFTPYNTSSNLSVAYNLPDVLSGKYDIYVVLVPPNMVDSSDTDPLPSKFYATLIYDFEDDGTDVSVSTSTDDLFTNDVTKVDTLLLFEDFEFPYCYYGLTSSFPILQLTVSVSLTERRYYSKYLYIDCFILEGKED